MSRPHLALLLLPLAACTGDRTIDPGPSGGPVYDGGPAGTAPRDGGSDQPNRDAGSVTARDAGSAPSPACLAYLEATCRYALRCGSKVPLLGTTLEGACHPAQRARYCSDPTSGLAAIRADEGAFQRCADNLDGTACLLSSTGLCPGLFVGTLPNGAACRDARECAGGRCLRATPQQCEGVCADLASDGEACVVHDECASRRCKAPELTCTPVVPLGGACNGITVDDCADSSGCVNGVCRTPGTAGAACTPSGTGRTCADPYLCTTGGCGFGAGLGEACGFSTRCAQGLRCADDVCVTAASSNGACTSDGACPVNHVCDGVCRPLPVVGEVCTATLPCAEGICDQGTCRLARPNEACTPRTDLTFARCESGYACIQAMCRPVGNPCGP
ncbi:MAG: hypothetical protein RMA76_04920 [Deltaproteobacteria bacterium]|jgi:hypothetical protein